MAITDFKDDPYLCLVRPLVQTYLAFYRTGSRHIESMGLTPSQFDVIAELGDIRGLTCADLSEATLVTKGTLTGVLDRLETKGMVRRQSIKGDRRAIKVRLTSKGQALFRKVFSAHAEFLRPYFQGALSPTEVQHMISKLVRLRESFEKGGTKKGAPARQKLKEPKVNRKRHSRPYQTQDQSKKTRTASIFPKRKVL